MGLLCVLVAPAARPPSRGSVRHTPAATPPVATATVASSSATWPMATGTWQNTRYSALDQIRATNAWRLTVAWTFHTGIMKSQEAAPIVAGSRLFVVTPYPNALIALDPVRGTTVWKYEPKPVPAPPAIACWDGVNRGAAYDNGRVFFNTLDGQTCAVDATSGRELWRMRVGDVGKGETLTMAPLVARGRVFVGNSGSERGVRGWLAALDAASGRVLWTAYSTGPDAEVRVGAGFRPHDPRYRGAGLGVRTWPPERWRTGGGCVDGFLAYDPDRDWIVHGTGSPSAWIQQLRPGDNQWTCGVFARDAATGAARWYQQWTPHDRFGYDGTAENVLVDLPWHGVSRHLLLHPDRNGTMYVLDRTTGEVLSSTPYVHVTTRGGADVTTGRPTSDAGETSRAGEVVRDVAPATPGAKEWQPSAFSPHTGLLYLPVRTLAMDFESTRTSYIDGTPWVETEIGIHADPVSPGTGDRGSLTAWDPLHARAAWSIPEAFPVWSGVLATAGDVVFYGTLDGWFKAVDARNGVLLWRYKMSSGVSGQPVTYLGPDGTQYVAVLAGAGGERADLASRLDAHAGTTTAEFVRANHDQPLMPGPGDLLYVFALQ